MWYNELPIQHQQAGHHQHPAHEAAGHGQHHGQRGVLVWEKRAAQGAQAADPGAADVQDVVRQVLPPKHLPELGIQVYC